MKAVVYSRYGPPEVLRLEEVPKPMPKENEVLIRIHATTVHRGDVRMRGFVIPRGMWLMARLALGITGPRRKILGMELSGEIEAVGAAVKRFSKGDQVFASTGFGGAYAEYICLPEDAFMALKPSNLTHEQATAGLLTGAARALDLLLMGNLQSGQKVLIYGASGSVGSFAVQLAKYFDAEVTAVCSTANLGLVRSLGADHVIDYTKEDLAKGVERYDLVLDAVGLLPRSDGKRALVAQGTFISVHRRHGGSKVEYLPFLKELVEAGKLRPVIDRTYPLEQIVAAHRYVDQGHKKGNVVIIVRQSEQGSLAGGRDETASRPTSASDASNRSSPYTAGCSSNQNLLV
jgi:NADPH:quinone reductase-like Zn-dependent oxidoreductase